MPAKRKRTATKKNTKAATYKVLIGFQFPADADVRRRIKASHEDGGGALVPLDERGVITRYETGTTFERNDIPAEVFDNLAQRGAFEPVGAKAKAPAATNGEEATNDGT